MAGDITFGVRLTGDSRGAIQALTLTRDELARLSQELVSAERSMRDSARSAEEARQSFSDWASETLDLKGALAGLAGAFAIDQIAEGATAALDRLQDIERTAQGLGISTKAVQELTYTFRQFNVDADDVTEGLAQLSSQALGAIEGSDGLIQTWQSLGITVDRLRGKKPDELFRLLAKGVAQTRDPVARLSAVSSLLGEDLAGKLMPALVQGEAGLDKFAGKANDLHVVLEDKLVKSGSEAAQKLQDLKDQLTAEFTRSVAANADEFTRLAGALGKVAIASGRVAGWFTDFGTWLGESAAQIQGFQTLEDKLSNLIRVREKWLSHGRSEDDPMIRAFDARIAKLQELLGLHASAQTPPELPAVNVSAPALANPADQFSPMEGFLSAIELARQDQFLNIDKLDDKLKGVADTSRQLQDMALQVGTGFADAFTGAVSGAESFGDSMKSLAADIAKTIFQAMVLRSIQTGVNAVFSVPAVASANGNVFDQSGLVPFANGGIVTRPTVFPMANGMGLMGEAGPEAIMPLKRLAGGKLGVHASGGGGVTVNAPITIHAPNADKQSVTEIAQITQRIPSLVTQVIVSDMHRDGPISRSIRR